MMSKIQIFPYDPSWPKKYATESAKIKECLGKKILSLHHIGSTSVEGLSAKEDIDILLVVKDLKESLKLSEIGYRFKGELNIPLRYFFSKNTEYSKVNLHVVEQDHGFILLNLTFRDFLRAHRKVRKEYEALKMEILKDPKNHEKMPTGHCTRYGSCKDHFIKKTLREAGFQDYTINFCHHDLEWESYERLIGPVKENEKISPSFLYFVLYKGVGIVAALKTSKKGRTLSINATEPRHLEVMKKWLIKWRNKQKSLNNG